MMKGANPNYVITLPKSKGDTLSVSVLKEKGYDPLAYRFMCLNSHYRKQLVFSFDALDQASSTLNKLRNKISNIDKSGDIQDDKYNLVKFQYTQVSKNQKPKGDGI